MHRLHSVKSDRVISGSIAVDTNVPHGFAHVCYEIAGFNTAYNPLATSTNGQRIRQTSLPIVFESGMPRRGEADGVSVEAVLAVCNDHLDTKMATPNGDEAYAEASAHIRRAIEILIEHHGMAAVAI